VIPLAITGLFEVEGTVIFLEEAGMPGHQFEASFQLISVPNHVYAGFTDTEVVAVWVLHPPEEAIV
jgi:hypothetical protein